MEQAKNKLTPDLSTAGANAMGGVAGYREPSARMIGLAANVANERGRGCRFVSNMAMGGSCWGVAEGGSRSRRRSWRRQHDQHGQHHSDAQWQCTAQVLSPRQPTGDEDLYVVRQDRGRGCRNGADPVSSINLLRQSFQALKLGVGVRGADAVKRRGRAVRFKQEQLGRFG